MTQRNLTNQPGRYDQDRLALFQPIKEAVRALGLPPLQVRKLNGILGALEMQIEDGGDSPEVNQLLLAALAAGVRHQVSEQQAQPVFQALETFAHHETAGWMQGEAGSLPPITLSPLEQLEELIQTGYSLLNRQQFAVACDQWQSAWRVAQQLITPAMRQTVAFDKASAGEPSFSDWTMDYLFELHNAGVQQPAYHAQRLGYVREFLALFPDEAAARYLEFRRAEGEALWALARTAEAEAVFQALIQKLPHKGWGYIGWSDQYYLAKESPKAYAQAEAILRQALAQPHLEDREWVLDRLKGLYREWGKPEAETAVAIELAALREGGQETAVTPKPKPGWIRKNKAKSTKQKKRGKRR